MKNSRQRDMIRTPNHGGTCDQRETCTRDDWESESLGGYNMYILKASSI